MKVRAKGDLNYGGIVKMKAGEVKEIDDKHAVKLIAMECVVEVKKVPKLKKKKDGDGVH
jgi:hypothetical protein